MQRSLWPTSLIRAGGTALTILLFSLASTPAMAQSSSLFGGGGATGSTGRATGGAGGAGASAGGGIGQNGLAQSALNLGGTGTIQPGQARQGGFVGRSDNSGRFVGQSMAGQQQTTGGGGTRRGGGNGGFGGGGGGNGGFGGNNFGGPFGNQFGGAAGNTKARVIRPQQRVAFEYSVPSTDIVRQTVSTRFQSMPTPAFRGLTVVTDPDGVFVLRGEVKSVADSKLAAAMLRQEPGVRTVRNELSIAPAVVAPIKP